MIEYIHVAYPTTCLAASDKNYHTQILTEIEDPVIFSNAVMLSQERWYCLSILSFAIVF